MIHQFLRLCLLRLWHKHKGSIEGVPIPSDFFFHKPRTRGGCPTICPCTEKLGGAHWQAWWSTLLSQDMCYMSMDGVSSSSVEKAGWAQETKYVNLVSQFGGRKEFFEVLWQHWISSEWCMCLVILHAGRWWSSIANSFYCWQVLRLPQPVFFILPVTLPCERRVTVLITVMSHSGAKVLDLTSQCIASLQNWDTFPKPFAWFF